MASDVQTRNPAGRTGLRRGALLAYRWVLLAFLLAALMQSLLAGLAGGTALYGGLHALDGLAILGIAGFLYASARRAAVLKG
jgi:hypothetical protein